MQLKSNEMEFQILTVKISLDGTQEHNQTLSEGIQPASNLSLCFLGFCTSGLMSSCLFSVLSPVAIAYYGLASLNGLFGAWFWRLRSPRAWCQHLACCVITGESVKERGWASSMNLLLRELTPSREAPIHPLRQVRLRTEVLRPHLPTLPYSNKNFGESPFKTATLFAKQQMFIATLNAVSLRFP